MKYFMSNLGFSFDKGSDLSKESFSDFGLENVLQFNLDPIIMLHFSWYLNILI